VRISVAILAMGGEGGGVLADWIVDLAEHNGYLAQATSVPGVAQRTGSTIYYLEMFPEAAARAAGQEPVFALMPVPGEVDVVVASELMEAGRAVQRGFVTADRTTLVASTNRVYSMIEKSAAGDGRVDSVALIAACEGAAKNFVRGDFAAIAGETGSVISAALFGALAATGALPFTKERFEEAIRRGGVGVEASLRAFAAAQTPRMVGEDQATPDILVAGRQRLVDYQDERYAEEYMRLLEPLRKIDAQGTLVRETARYLALWMSYEDAIRVADLKIRRARFERVRREARATPDQVLKIQDFLFPRIGEITDVLPAALGRWLLKTGWARGVVERFTRHGRIIETSSVSGYLQLRGVAGLRRWRRRSLRFEREQRRIRDWLALVEEVAAENYELALEVAQCAGLLKGYGDTYVRASRKFEEVMGAVGEVRCRPDGAAALRALRETCAA
jgi:indolepyruvate ferredoxin oxidoreductase beta subunit